MANGEEPNNRSSSGSGPRCPGIYSHTKPRASRRARSKLIDMSGQRHIENIALIGFMGTGKSSVGQIVAAQLHFSFLDTDELIESRAGRSVTEIFSQAGETMFRDLEKQLL